MHDLYDLIRLSAQKKASDLFIKANSPPAMRISGRIQPLDEPPLTAEETRTLAYSVMTHEQIGRFEHRHELDLAFEVEGVCRIRCNVYQQRGTMGLVCRLIPLKIFSLEQLGMPSVIGDTTKNRQGLILVTGPTGSGKSTTQAAMIDLINSTRRTNIITVEDPIEFVHPDKMSIVSQREVGLDTDSFHDALKYSLRQNPDILLIGEMRDIETMNVALAAAETGHLVFSTLHTASAAETLDRIINMYPPQDRDMLCLRLSGSLKGVISQKLVPRADGTGRVGAVETMIATPTIIKLIEEGRASQLYGAIAEGNFWGMQTMNQCLLKYFRAGLISEEEAISYAGNVTEMKQMVRRPA
ncbi:twitching motility protein PilT [Capsulimonas corticalis]|uniref:Twitching motility protein PilT n=1 Tax=Capsulimonas corticalis TaxID=2219043 RepID=A0A402CXK5_9BACT|nr:type IV pilus twitching motility protein PilT [Capsulimonas corticalis]BDI32246.1 twitching motility protein PilT [Capsulimonas corticalis]